MLNHVEDLDREIDTYEEPSTPNCTSFEDKGNGDDNMEAFGSRPAEPGLSNMACDFLKWVQPLRTLRSPNGPGSTTLSH